MALRFIEGWENSQDPACYTRKWAAFLNSGGFVTGRLHGFAITGSGSASIGEYRTRGLGLQNSWVVGMGFRHLSGTVVDSTTNFPLVVKRGVAEQLRFQWRKGVGNTFNIQVFSGATLIGQTSDLVPISWHYLEFKFTVDTAGGATGFVEIRRNTQVEFTSSVGIDTADTGLAGADLFEINTQNLVSLQFDDIYMLDDTGSINNDYLGDSVIEGRRPSANGTTNDWSLDNGGNGTITQNFDAVDKTSCTGGENDNFIFSATVSDLDLFSFNALSFITGQIHCVMMASDASLDTTGTREFKHKIRSNAVNYDAGIDHTVASTSVQSFYDVVEVDPDTGVKWTISGVDNAEFGVEVVS